MSSHARGAFSAILFALFLVSPVHAETLESTEGQRLSSEEIATSVSGQKLEARTANGREIRVTFDPDGTMAGRMGGSRDRGKWWVENDQFCRQWNNWVGRKQNCYVVVKDGAMYKWFESDGKLAWKGIFSK